MLFKARREDLVALLKLIWRQGIVAGYRRQFWRQLVGIYRQNPSRLAKYLAQCAMGENLFQIRASLLPTAARPGPNQMPPLNQRNPQADGLCPRHRHPEL